MRKNYTYYNTIYFDQFFFFLIGLRTRPSVVSTVSRRGDDVRPRVDHNVQTTGTDGDWEQSCGFCRKFVSLIVVLICYKCSVHLFARADITVSVCNCFSLRYNVIIILYFIVTFTKNEIFFKRIYKYKKSIYSCQYMIL